MLLLVLMAVVTRSNTYERPKRRRRRRERQSPETETDTSQESDLRRVGIIPESVLLNVPEVDMCSIEDELEAVKKRWRRVINACLLVSIYKN